jgi:hypothetical protein
VKKTDIISGSIFEIPLEKEFGYGYVKLIFTKDVQPDYFDLKLIKPINHFRKKPVDIRTFDLTILETDDLLIFPITMHGFPKLRGSDKWNFIGVSSLTEEDQIIPDFLDEFGNLSPEDIERIAESEYGFSIVRNGQNKRLYTKDFDLIRHLGKWERSSPNAIRTLLTMTWILEQKEDISKYYSDIDYTNDFWLGYTRNKVLNGNKEFINLKKVERLKAKI